MDKNDPIERNEIFSLIDAEFKAIEHLDRRNGWSRWILIGAIVGCLAVITDAYYKKRFLPTDALTVFAALSWFAMPLAGLILSQLTSAQPEIQTGRLVPASRQFSISPATVVVLSIWLLIVALEV